DYAVQGVASLQGRLEDDDALGGVGICARLGQRSVHPVAAEQRRDLVPRRIPGDGAVPVLRPELDDLERLTPAGRAAGEICLHGLALRIAGPDQEDRRVASLLQRVAAEVAHRLVVQAEQAVLRAEGAGLVARVARE